MSSSRPSLQLGVESEIWVLKVRNFRKVVGLCTVLAPSIIFADLTGTYVFTFGEPEDEIAFRKASGTQLLAEWREASAKNGVILEVRATDVENQFDGTWKDPKEALETSKINLRGEEFSFVFSREVDDVKVIFSMEGTAKDDQLQGVLWTVWGEVPVTGVRAGDVRGSYALSFGKLLEEGAITEYRGTRLLDEWRESATNGELVLELRDADVKNQIDVTWKDSTTEDVEDFSFPLHPNPIPHGADVFFLFARMVNEMPFLFLFDGEIKKSELQGTLRTVWGDIELTGKLLKEDHSSPS